MKYDPYPYQQYCHDRIIDTPRIGLFLDMGLGKTVITLSAIKDLKYNRWAVKRVLVIAPKKVAEDTWQTEAAKWDHLSCLRVVGVTGTATQRMSVLLSTADVYVISRDNTKWLVDHFGYTWPFDMVVLDESTSFKNHQAVRYKAIEAVSPKINRLVELTGTPSPHGLLDLWAPIHLLDGGKRLGRTMSVYRDIFFVPYVQGRSKFFSYALKEGAEEAIHQAISDICISMSAKDYLDLPDLIYNDVPVVLDGAARRAYDEMEQTAVMELDEDEVITANNAASLSGKLLQLCNGSVYDENHNATHVHDCKLEALLEVIEQLNGQHAVVCYYFKHDMDRLTEALARTGLRVRVYQSNEDKDDWNAGKIDLLLIHPSSCGYGLNLQEGGHHIIWFALTWNLEEYQQANKRLHRQGQKHPVIVHHLIVKGGRDEDVIKSLESKGNVQENLLESLKVRIARVKEEMKKK